jgi:hypothetical protein
LGGRRIARRTITRRWRTITWRRIIGRRAVVRRWRIVRVTSVTRSPINYHRAAAKINAAIMPVAMIIRDDDSRGNANPKND